MTQGFAWDKADTQVKAWVNFDGTGTVAIRASYNVSSITDNGTGDYTVNFTNVLLDDKYAPCSMSDTTLGYASYWVSPRTGTATNSSFRFYTRGIGDNNGVDVSQISLSFFR